MDIFLEDITEMVRAAEAYKCRVTESSLFWETPNNLKNLFTIFPSVSSALQRQIHTPEELEGIM